MTLLLILVTVAFYGQTAEPTSVRAAPTNMPNIGKLLSGYDILRGNPLPVEPFPVDPGFREPIFEASYSGSMTADQRYRQPDGTTISSCIGTCSLKFSSTKISGAKSYQESLARKVGVSVGASWGWGGKFSASYGYKEVAEKTSSESKLFTLASASCCAYSAELLSYNLPSLSQNFLYGFRTLTEKYDETIYFDFIQAFGTHFIKRAHMGSLFGEQSEISKSEWTTMLKKGIDIDIAAELSAYLVAASSQVSQNDVEKAKIFASKKEIKRKVITMGAKPPADGKRGTWIQKTISDPAPIALTLGGSLLDLLEHDDIKAEVSTAVKANMKRALDDYCDLLHKFGEVKTCSSPGPDPAFPSPASAEYSEPVAGCLKGLNNIRITGTTLEECKSQCSAATTIVCNSLDYLTITRKCHLSTETKKSRPNAYHEPCYVPYTESLYLERKDSVSCRGGATLLSASPGRDMVLCKDKTESTCEKDFESLCPAGWNLCHPSQFNNRNSGWDFNVRDANAGYPHGFIFCRRPRFAGQWGIDKDYNPVLSTDVLLNTDRPWGSNRPECGYCTGDNCWRDCNDKDSNALCCAPTSTCGDGMVQHEEDCDDGNNSNFDDCLNSCTWRIPEDHSG